MMRPFLAAISILIAPGVAEAQGAPAPCGTAERPWIRIDAVDEAVVAALRTELAEDGFDACRDGGPAPPLARATVTALEARYAIEIVDLVTSKRVGRDLDVGTIPRDGRALALALATEELLRASWAELVVAGAPPPVVAVPAPVQRSVERSVRPTVTPRPAQTGAIAVMLGGEAFSGGQAEAGVDARAEWFVSSAFATTLRFGLRTALPQRTGEGEVRASVALGGIGAAYRLLGSAPVALRAFLRLDAADVTYTGEPRAGATATSGNAWTLLGSGGGELGWSILPALRLNAEVGAVVPLRPVHATQDGSAVVSSVSGVGLAGGIGAGGVF